MLEDLIDEFIKEYRANPRNKIFVNEELLLASATEESGSLVISQNLRDVISGFIAGDLDDTGLSTYDAATYCCSLLANHCFSTNESDLIDFEIFWIQNDDGGYTAEIRPY